MRARIRRKSRNGKPFDLARNMQELASRVAADDTHLGIVENHVRPRAPASIVEASEVAFARGVKTRGTLKRFPARPSTLLGRLHLLTRRIRIA